MPDYYLTTWADSDMGNDPIRVTAPTHEAAADHPLRACDYYDDPDVALKRVGEAMTVEVWEVGQVPGDAQRFTRRLV